MTTSKRFRFSTWLLVSLIVANAAVALWVLLLGHFAMPVRIVTSFSAYRELETNRIINVEELAEFRDGEYVDNLHLFTTGDLVIVANQVTSTSNVVAVVLLTDCIALIMLMRRRRVDNQPA